MALTPLDAAGLDPGIRVLVLWLRSLGYGIGIPVTPGMIRASYDPADERAVISVFGVTDAMLPEEIRRAFG